MCLSICVSLCFSRLVSVYFCFLFPQPSPTLLDANNFTFSSSFFSILIYLIIYLLAYLVKKFLTSPPDLPLCFCIRFDSVSDLVEPVSDGIANHCFISKSYDATSHFETAANDVLSLYERITGDECPCY